MNDSIWQSIANTPWWIFVLVAYILYAGYLATQPRLMPIRIFYATLMMITLASIIGMAIVIEPSAIGFASWAVMGLLGTGIGWLHFRALNIKVIKESETLQMPGTWRIFIVILFALITHHYYDFKLNFNPLLFKTGAYSFAIMATYGFFTGLILGRLSYARHALKYGPYVLG